MGHYNPYEEEDELLVIWNRVTKRVISVRGREAATAEIAKQKYPQNWVVNYPDSCRNCGGSWDGNRDCANYCTHVVVRREDPNPDMTDLGECGSWQEVFDKAFDLYCEEKLDMLGTLSLVDYMSGRWFAPVITDAEFLRSLAKAAPEAYPQTEKFRLLLADTILEPSRLRKVSVQLVVVRLQAGETLHMPAKQTTAAV